MTIIISGDVACRLGRLPKTRHAVILSDDAGGLQSSRLGAHWFPQGFEGLVAYDFFGTDRRATAEDAADLVETPWRDSRRYLLHDLFSVNERKPSRQRLVQALVDGAGDDLASLARDRGLGLSLVARDVAGDDVVAVRVAPADGTTDETSWRANVANSLFALCPAGDVYSSGRVVAALALGAVPVVDVTYQTHPDSAKGCADPAAFWRSGAPDFPHAAPFVFVDDWARLPELLADADPVALLADLADYQAHLLTYLRTLVLDPPRSSSSPTCHETPLDANDRATLLRDAARYYGNDHAWFDRHRDNPADPGATCVATLATEMTGLDMGTLCFDAACAPPQVKAFDCH